jgi:hypothetical protein
MQRNPLRTKMAQGGLICTGGDLIAQAITAKKPPSPADRSVPGPGSDAAVGGWDARRTTVYAVLGVGWTGVFNHYYLNILSAWFPAAAGMRSAVAKTFVNQLVVAPLGFVPMFFLTNGLVRGWSADRTL